VPISTVLHEAAEKRADAAGAAVRASTVTHTAAHTPAMAAQTKSKRTKDRGRWNNVGFSQCNKGSGRC
jgi:hypothetical protein